MPQSVGTYEVQLRSEETGLHFAQSFREAVEMIITDVTIWKLSFTYHGQDHRLVRQDSGVWENRPIVLSEVMIPGQSYPKCVVITDLVPIEGPLFNELNQLGLNVSN